MATSKAKIEAEWDKDLEDKLEKKADEWSSKCGSKSNVGSSAGAGAVYGLGLLGALVYYIQTATSFWDGFVGVLQALVWPAFLIYELLQFLKM